MLDLRIYLRPVLMGLAVSITAHAQTMTLTAIKCGRLFDGKTLSLQENVVMLVEGNKIRALGKSIAVPAEAKVIDLSQATVMPPPRGSLRIRFLAVEAGRTANGRAVPHLDKNKRTRLTWPW
jgi:hypothetical protein